VSKRYGKSMQGRRDRWHKFSFNPMLTTAVVEGSLKGSAHLQIPLGEAPIWPKGKAPCSLNNRRYRDAQRLTAARKLQFPNHETRQQRRWLEREYAK
jgi:hypothetical protein